MPIHMCPPSGSQITGLEPEKLYDELLKEFLPSWLPKARALGIVTT